MAYSFNGSTKTITLSSGTTTMGVRDLWSRWVDWFLTSDNSKYPLAFSQVGGNDIDASAGTSIPIYAFLQNGWKVKPQEANHTLNVNDGILLVEGGGDPFTNTTGSYIVRINYSQPVQAITVATGGGGGGYTPSQIADAVWDEVLTGATHNVPASAGRRLRQLGQIVVYDGIAQGAGTGSNQIQLDTGASSVDGAYDPSEIAIIGGTGAGQSRMILQYEGSTRIATVDRNWRVNPDATSEFIIYVNSGREHVNEGLAQGGTTHTITLNANASEFDDAYIGQTVFLRSGTGQDQVARITDYNGTTKVASIETYIGNGWQIVPDTTTAYVVIPYSGGLTVGQDSKLFSLENSTNAGFSFNYNNINNHTSKKIEELKKTIEEIPTADLSKVTEKLDEIESHNSFAKEEIINRIEEVENEIGSDIVRSKKELKEDNISTRNLVRQKSDKVVKFATKQLDTMERIEKEIEDTENEIKEEFERIEQEEKEISDLFDMYDKDEEEIRAEFDKLDSNT